MVSNTITNPWTMVVHFGHTDATVLAMMASLRLPRPTMITNLLAFTVCYFRHLPRSFQGGSPIWQHSEATEPIKKELIYGPIHFILHPLIHFIISYIHRAQIQKANNKSHWIYETTFLHAFTQELAEELVTTFADSIHGLCFFELFGK